MYFISVLFFSVSACANAFPTLQDLDEMMQQKMLSQIANAERTTVIQDERNLAVASIGWLNMKFYGADSTCKAESKHTVLSVSSEPCYIAENQATSYSYISCGASLANPLTVIDVGIDVFVGTTCDPKNKLTSKIIHLNSTCANQAKTGQAPDYRISTCDVAAFNWDYGTK